MDRSDPHWPHPEELLDHATFRPEWESGVECLYWYLTFEEGALSRIVDGELGELVVSTPWLDPVPVEWMHLTVCEVGFVEHTAAEAVGRVVEQVRESTAGHAPFELTLGPVLTFPRALTVAGGPLESLRELQRRTHEATVDALGDPTAAARPHRAYWPHLSVGYVNRPVSAAELAELRGALPELDLPAVPVDRLVLTSVARQGRSYRWTVHAEAALGGGGRA